MTSASSEQKRQLLAKLLQKAHQPQRFLLSFAQRRLWFLDQLQPGSPAYNIPTALHLTGSLDIAALEASLNHLIQRHEILRSRFVAINGEPFVEIHLVTISIPLIDLRSLPPTRQQQQVKIRCQQAAQASFDLTKPPLLRATLLQLSECEYVLLFTMHHIIADYWSMRLFVRELTTIYQGYAAQLPELPIQYVDYAAWQQNWLNSPEKSSQLAYWQAQLADYPPLLELPTDYPRPAVQSFRGARRSFSLDAELSTALKNLSQRQGVTLFMLLLAAFKILLHRYTQQNDVLVGSTIANRNRSEITHLIGLFVNNLVFRTNLAGNPQFHAFLQQVREITLGAYAHQDLPYEYLVEQLQPERNLGYNPLFQVMFILHNTPTQEVKVSNLSLSYLEPEQQTARFDLSLDMYETASGLRGIFEYNTDLFSATTVDRIIGNWQTLLAGIVAHPEQRIGELPLLTSAEQRLLSQWNDTSCEFSSQCVHELFAAQAEKTPDAIAAVFESEQITYRELNARANQLAHHLQAIGVRGDRIGICVKRSINLLIGLLGILKAGATYIPLDPSHPRDRLTFMLEDAAVEVLIQTARSLIQSRTNVYLDDWTQFTKYSRANPPQISAENPAYTIYTSGSTGKPKGVQILHKSLVNLLQSIQEYLQITPNDVLVATTTVVFDIAALELYLPLLIGARVVIASRDTATDGGQLQQCLANTQATVMQSTPATWNLLIDSGWQGNSHLTQIISGGEALMPRLAKQLQARTTQVWNVYGPTETTIWSSIHCVKGRGDKLDDLNLEVIPIGKPLANTQFYVLDGYLQPVPIGVPGELYIGSVGVAQGYLNRLELTAERFIPNPFRKDAISSTENRLYKTGDLVRYRVDGTLEHLGRVDYQVKLRGFRIELDEIAAVLNQHPDVQQAIVVLDNRQTDPRLIAYIVFQSPVAHFELRQFLQTKLPAHMIPAAYVTLDKLPLTPNGKIDRRALPSAEVQLQPNQYIAPRNPIEEILAEIWAETLELAQVGIEDNFFELGGHSLLATRVISQVRRMFGIELPLRRLFETPTIAELALEIATTKSASPLVEITRVDRQEIVLSFAQQRQWFLSQLHPESAFYNIFAALQIDGELDIAILQRSLNEVLARHEVLRTAVRTIEGQPIVQISSTTLEFPLLDLSALPASTQAIQARKIIEQEAQQPFKLDQPPLLRVKLLRLDQSHALLLTLHHIAADAWSMGVLVREIVHLYQAYRHDTPPRLLPLPIQYADFAAWQRQWLQNVQQTQLNYWRQQLQGANALLELPTDYPRPPVQTGRGGKCRFQLSQELSLALKRLSQKAGCTLFMTLIAAFQVLLYRYSDCEDIIVGTAIANRHYPQVEGLIGFFANTLALRTDLSGNPSFAKLLQRVKQVALGAYTHQDLPFEQLIDELQIPRSLSYNPLFQVMFLLQPAAQTLAIEGLNWSLIDTDNATAKFDLTLSMSETSDGLVGNFEYSQDLFAHTTIERMVGHWQTLLAAIAQCPQQQIAQLPLLTESEYQIFISQNPQNVKLDVESFCIHQLFEVQVRANPDAIALVSQSTQITYQELNDRANQLAQYLRRLGVKPETRVGICLERSAELVVGILGILKAGAAYVPLDLAYPQARLNYMLEDAQVSVLIQTTGQINISPLNPRHLLQRGTPHASLLNGGNPRTQQASQRSGSPTLGDFEKNGSSQNSRASKTNHPSTQQRRNCDRAIRIVNFDTDWEIITQESTANLDVEIDLENLAYVIYTSGSTGQPKGVAIAHRNATTLVNWAHDVFSTEEIAGVLASTSICFDLSIFEIFVPLCGGGKVLLAENALQLPDLAAKDAVTLINTVPSAIAQLSTTNAVPQSVQTINLAGEALQRNLVKQLQQHSHLKRILNLYGPTEDTTYSTYAIVESQSPKNPPIGQAIAHTQTYILDRYLQPVPVGVPGELYLGGAGLARGYLNRPELTAEKFIPNPFNNSKSHRLYKTGDRVRYLADGNIEYLGRFDDQVKVRGFRIELGEIETALSQHPVVQQAVAIQNQSSLVAYVVLNFEIDLQQLRQFLRQQLPDYMIPPRIRQLAAIPLTPNGKIDRRALLELDSTEEDRQVVSPQSPQEQILTEIWGQLLGIDTVSVNDNFFALGGDSILAIQLIAKAKAAGLQLSPKQIFQYQTIAELAVVAKTTTVVAQQSPVTGKVPLTPIQHWFFAQNFVDLHHWNQSILLQLDALVTFAAFAHSIRYLLTHHDALRLRFHHTSAWQQTVAGVEDTIPLLYIDLSSLPPQQQESTITSTASQLQTSLDLANGLVRVAFFYLGNRQPHRVLFIVHHLAIDGVSWRILLTDLQTALQQLQVGEAIQLPPKTTSFKHWAEALQTYAESSLQPALAYWQNLPQTILPVDNPDGENTVAQTQTYAIALDVAETQALLHKVPTAYQTQINDVLLTALVQAFTAWTQQQGLLVELEGHGREDLFADIDVSRTVGWFTTLFPIWLSLESDDLDTALKSIKEQLRQIPDRGISYGILRYLKSQLHEIPSAQVRFNYLGQVDQVLASSLLTPAVESPGAVRSQRGKRDVLIEINAIVAAGQLRLDWEYSSAVHHPQTIANVAQQYLIKLRKLIDYCTSPDAGGYTPSDFPQMDLTQAELDERRIYRGRTMMKKDIEDIYPLSPMQQGILFHSLLTPEVGVYVPQVCLTIDNLTNINSFAGAWQTVLQNNASLRTAFRWERRDQPFQVVYRDVELPWQQYDWREEYAQHKLEAFLLQDRQHGFDLKTPPLFRLTLIQLDATRYLLIWTQHHLILDGWSAGLILKEVFDVYHALEAGSDIPKVYRRPYADYIHWLQQQDASAAQAFWEKRLEGFTTPNSCLGNFPQRREPPHGSFRLAIPQSQPYAHEWEEQQISLSASTTKQLKQLSQHHQFTFNTLLQGALAILLSRYCDTDDIVFGATTSGRPPELSHVESMVGLFINTIPVRVQVPDQEFLIPWLQKLQLAQVAAISQYQFTPLLDIQTASEIPKGAALFECILVYENYPVDATSLHSSAGLQIESVNTHEWTSFPLTLVVSAGEELTIKLKFDRSRFSDAIARFLANFQVLLEGIAANPQQRLGDLPILTLHEQQLLGSWNSTAIEYPTQQCIHELFVAQVEKTPDAIALIFNEAHLTYRELNSQVNQLATQLQDLGVCAEVLVGVCLERSVEMVVAILAVLKAGGAYVPLDPQLPQERLDLILADAQVEIIIQNSATGIAVDVKDGDAPASMLSHLNSPSLGNFGRFDSDNSIYVIYTSGSTGKPKGVINTHRSLVNRLCWMQDRYQLTTSDRVLQKTPFGFDVSVWEFFWTLLNGACLVVAKPGGHQDSQYLADVIAKEQITTIHFVPSMLQAFLEEPELNCPSLKCVFCSGEALSIELQNHFFTVFDAELHNLYGPTEAAIDVTYFECTPSLNTNSVPIGRPIANTQTYILNSHQRQVPIGVAGELYLAGDNLARGYLNLPELTAEKFIPNPFRDKGIASIESRIYKTGDRARYLKDGNIEFLGRIDRQVKLRGFRIELGEIEAVLMQHSKVQTSVVVVKDEYLVAYVVPTLNSDVASAEIRTFLETKLPPYMIPTSFVFRESLPLTPNGKLDRRALAIDEIKLEARSDVLPRNDTENAIAAIWQEVLQLEQVGVYDNFFELGGNSLLATRINSRLRTSFQLELPLRSLFEKTTIAALAEYIQTLQMTINQLQTPVTTKGRREIEL
ncbi:non-ribosomal peptide synthetase (plasmid) [Gloeocapsa sp. PCC 7428]|uniref:non-ribosomal peptide synthetase n=1 Tax=Gloeocapsa sp. PCC 7428 TaxID=1173026 RepID=UPI0002A5D9B4|nr:non-ribosomal peptide synthetase [Gloeocapsa sp. PCC 7428]AFZ33306.1 non-ribosomal peptide synthetase [Gloeocapsa sp. PCC 7428]